jgi:transcriptional regulator with XRE-family HTH domain
MTISTIERRMTSRAGLVAVPGLRYWRRQFAISQLDLAVLARVSMSTVQRLEAGQAAQPSIINRLACALEITPAQLMAAAPDA